MRFRLNPIAFLLLYAFTSLVYADENDELTLKLDNVPVNIQENHPAKGPDNSPIFISAERMEGHKDGQIEALGEVELRKRGQAIYADRILFFKESKDLSAVGAVRVEQDNNVILSPQLKFNLDTSTGDMTKPVFRFGDTHARGNADNLHLAGREDYILHNVNYTTCPADQDDWLLKVRELEIDRNNQLGIAHGARVEFMGVPILYTPWMDFGLNSQRKSGFLGPVFGSTVSGGSDLSLPYYWNIAPNLDATLSPRIMTKRGILFNNELRYLEPTYSGEAHLDVLPGDHLAGSTRSRLTLKHVQSLGNGLSDSINFTRVSDDAYFRDLSDTVSGTSQTTLLREGVLSYAGSWWDAQTRVQSFQTLQDPAAPVTPPYNRLPQFSLSAQRVIDKASILFAGEFVDFHHPTLVNGRRLVLYPGVSYPLVAQPSFYMTPKLGLHYTNYSMGDNNFGSFTNTSRALPIFSLDSGMTMERDWTLTGHDFVQTLEPRAYYVYIPYHDQSLLPNFDSVQGDFNFAQMFTENRFLGSDRIGDANQVTLALTSRLLEPDSGAERLRIAIGQRFSANTPRVNLVTPTSSTNKSDILLAASGQINRFWSMDSTYQVSPNQSQTQLFNASARYQPEAGKVLNLGYRFTRNSLRQLDLSAQWPVSVHWRGVARWNYSIQDGRILEALGGLEYNQRCWTVRMVAQRFATATQQDATGFFIQLELNDLVAVGADPLSLLRQSIPGYTKLGASVLDTPEQDQK